MRFFHVNGRSLSFLVICAAALGLFVACGDDSGGGNNAGADGSLDDGQAQSDAGLQPGECFTAADCQDDSFCNGTEVCDGATADVPGSCLPGTAPTLDDGVDCTVDTCDDVLGEVVHTPDHTVCDDQTDCNGPEQCDVALGCQPGVPPANADDDGDGFTPADGDCDDCDPLVNPSAVDLPGNGVDDNCDGQVDEPMASCDANLLLSSLDPLHGAAAMDLCRQAATPQDWGIVSAQYVRANGAAHVPATEIGLQVTFGNNVTPQSGNAMLHLSTGSARTIGQPDACGDVSCTAAGAGVPPLGFPQDVPNCAGSSNIHDDVALEVTLRAPSNVTGFQFYFLFTSFEFPEYVCTAYNDQFIALMTPAPADAINGNVAFDSQTNPVSVNIGLLDHCDPSQVAHFAENCASGCPAHPIPYCPNGDTLMDGTGFNTWGIPLMTPTTAGSTGWLRTTVPVQPGQQFTLRFAVWDTGDQSLDSAVLIDAFAWLVGNVVVGTEPPP